MRAWYFLLGWTFFALGAVGVVLPGVPTTPFMLLALWAFARSSRRLHDWLLAHAVLGPPLQRWRSHRVIPTRVKVLSVTMMAASLAFVTFFTDLGTALKVVIALLMLYGAMFVLSKPSHAPDSESS